VEPTLDKSIYDVLGVEKAVGGMCSAGSTGPEHVMLQVQQWKKRLGIK
jgi:argininosuccinate lyase